jgi:very-short-patch-repair endonuclease
VGSAKKKLKLRNFLEYAERNCDLPSDIPLKTGSETNEFEEAVSAALVDRGFKVDMQVGASRYRIDLAVRDPHDERHYVLGVECDGVTYHSSRTARDRDLLRQLVLQRMGWRIHRLWSTEWFHDPEKAISGILRSIEQAQASPAEKPVPAPPVSGQSAPSQGSPKKGNPGHEDVTRKYKAGVPYYLFKPSNEARREHLLDRRYSNVLSNTISALVMVEGPIHHDLLIERLKAIHDIAKVGSNIQSNIRKALSAAKRRGSITVNAKDNSFYYDPDNRLETFRLPNDIVRRPVEHIAPEELSLAILYLVEDQFGFSEERLPSAVARHMGIKTLRRESSDVISAVIDDLVARKMLRRNGSQIHLF